MWCHLAIYWELYFLLLRRTLESLWSSPLGFFQLWNHILRRQFVSYFHLWQGAVIADFIKVFCDNYFDVYVICFQSVVSVVVKRDLDAKLNISYTTSLNYSELHFEFSCLWKILTHGCFSQYFLCFATKLFLVSKETNNSASDVLGIIIDTKHGNVTRKGP